MLGDMLHRTLRVMLASASLLAVGACGGSLEVTHVLTGPRLPPHPDGALVPAYFNESPGRAYREVAQIRVRSRGDDAALDQVVAAAARDARELGADAILVDLRSHYDHVQVHIGCDGRPHVDPVPRLNARVTAIEFVPQGAAPPEAPPDGPPPIRERCGS